jgi:hypothetical protein
MDCWEATQERQRAMKPRRAAMLTLAGWVLLGASFCWAQSATKTFTAPDGAFTFRYWENLVHCKHLETGSNAWDPGDICMAYIPVCDDLIGREHQTSIACFAYPRNNFTNTPAFEAATFSVEIVNDEKTEKGCRAARPDSTEKPAGTTAINGVSFAVIEFGDSAMNQWMGGHAYRTFHSGKCYQLGVNFAESNPVDYDPPIRSLTDKDENEINGRLDQTRKSFRFLK